MRALLIFLILLFIAQPSIAIREGTATAAVFIEHYTHSGDFGRLALWHETAAECLARISIPMNEIAHAYYVRHNYGKWAARTKKEALEIQKQFQYHCTRAETAWQKCMEIDGNSDAFSGLEAERRNIAKFIETWLPRYPNRFYEFGIYPTFFRKQRELAERNGSYAEILRLEADAAEMCAAQYQQIPIAYGLKRYEKFREAYLRHARHLRQLAKQNPTMLPPEVDKGKRILNSLVSQIVSSRQKAEVVLQIAKSDARVKAALAAQNGVHAYPSFQGFAWIVSFSNHSCGNLATAIVDVKMMEVLLVYPCIQKP